MGLISRGVLTPLLLRVGGGKLTKITDFFTEIMRRFLPDPFVFAIILTLLAMIMAFFIEGQAPLNILQNWGDGFWSLLAFTAQMTVILAMGYVLATAPIIDRFLDKVVGTVKTPRQAIIMATLVGGIGCYLNWGFGLVIGTIMARKLAKGVKGVHYPLIIASAYSGFSIWGLGLSGSIPLLISTKGHAFEQQMGIIPLSETIFSLPIIVTVIVVLATLPFLNALLHPKLGEKVIEIQQDDDSNSQSTVAVNLLSSNSFAEKLNNSKILSMVIGLCGLAFVIMHFINGGSLDLNIINYFILFFGIILLGTPMRYINSLNGGVKTVGGIVLQFPFYAGIMAIMESSGLVKSIAQVFVNFATPDTLPLWGLISSYFINFFAPSGGGHWVIQGPFMVEAAHAMNASVAQTSMSVMLGSCWNDLIQPFWLLPALAISKLKLQDIMGYTVVMMFWIGIIFTATVVIWPHL